MNGSTGKKANKAKHFFSYSYKYIILHIYFHGRTVREFLIFEITLPAAIIPNKKILGYEEPE